MRAFCRIVFVVALVAGAAIGGAAAGKKQLTPELVARGESLVRPHIRRLAWRPGSDEISYLRRDGSGDDPSTALMVYDAASGREQKLFSSAEEKVPLQLASYQWSPRGRALLVEGDHDLWLVDAGSGSVRWLTDATEGAEDPEFSPDGREVAFVKNNNLDMLDLASGKLTELTHDGSLTVMNGKLDWVYEEELASRATGRAYEWSPDGKRIAYLRLDDGPVPVYPITHYLSTHVMLSDQRFPQSGDANPAASFHVVEVSSGEDETWRAPAGSGVEYFGPSFTWTPDSSGVAFLTLNRHQTELALHLWRPATDQRSVSLTERDPYWINSLAPPYFLKDASRFLWLSERDGWLHLYLCDEDGRPEREITRGDWMIDHPLFSDVPMFQVDERDGWVYFASTRPDPRERQLYRARISTGAMERLTLAPGTHSFNLSPDGRFLIDNFSNLSTPPQYRLLFADGRVKATLDRAENDLDDYALGAVKLLEVKAADGATLDARMLTPPDFDAGKKYPVIVSVYNGPHVQLVQNRWGATSLLDQLFAEKGFIVWTLDGRGSWGRGHAWESVVFEHLGRQELADQLAGVDYLKALPYVDANRIGIWGWSYGGYMTLYALTHAPDVFKCGAAGGPVTDWKFYDSIYTERYMRTPAENPEGYQESSPLAAAGRLTARVLLIHGTDDDNVHLQNTMNFVEALVKAGRPFELYLQPGQKHGFAGEAVRAYLNQRLLYFFQACR